MLQIGRVDIPEYWNLKVMGVWGGQILLKCYITEGTLPIYKCVSERLVCPYNGETSSPVSTLRCSPIQSERPDWLEPAAKAKPPPLDQDYYDHVADVGDHLSIRRPQGKKSAMVFHSRRGGGKTTSSQGPAWLTKGQKSILQAKISRSMLSSHHVWETSNAFQVFFINYFWTKPVFKSIEIQIKSLCCFTLTAW